MKASPYIGPSSTIGAIRPSRLRPAVKAVVFQWPWRRDSVRRAATVLEGEVVLRRLKAVATQFAKDAAIVVAGRVSS